MSINYQTIIEENSTLQLGGVAPAGIHDLAQGVSKSACEALILQLKEAVERLDIASQSIESRGHTQKAAPLFYGSDIENAIKEWEKYQEELAKLKQEMLENLKKMVEMVKSGHVEQAFMFAQQKLLPSVMAAKGGGISVLAGSSDIATALRMILTQIQNEVNKATETKPNVEAIAKALMALFQQLEKYFGPNSICPPWMDENTWKTIKGALSSFLNLLGIKDPNSLNQWENAVKTIYGWGYRSPQLQQLYSTLQQYNTAVSALSQGLNAETQFAASEYNQLMASMKAMLQATMQSFAAMVKNQTTN